MSVPGVHFSEVVVHRMLGIQLPGFSVQGLKPAINIIHGSTGSGKTTTARAIELILHAQADKTSDAIIAGTFDLSGNRYTVSLDTGRLDCECNGRSVTAPELGPRENRERYRLELHDLMRAETSGFAKAVLDASHGGMDVAAAQARLGFKTKPSRTRGCRNDVRRSFEQCRTATTAQRAVEARERDLASLSAARDKIEPTRARLQLLVSADRLLDARDELAGLQEQFEQLDSRMEKITGNESELIEQCRGDRTTIQSEIDNVATDLSDARSRLEEANVSEEGLAIQQIEEWKDRSADLREGERDICTWEQSVETAEVEVAEARSAIPGSVSDEQLTSLGPAREDELVEFAREAEELRTRQTAVHQRRTLLGEPAEHTPPEDLVEGIRILGRWLRSPASPESLRREPFLPLFVAAALIALIGVVLAATDHWAWVFTCALAPLPWLVQFLRRTFTRKEVDRRLVHIEEFQRTGLANPAEWSEDSVADAINALEQDLAAAQLEVERNMERNSLDREEEDLGKLSAALQEKRDEIEERIGISPQCDDIWLHRVVNAISRWQAASSARATAKATLKTERRQYEERRKLLHDALVQRDDGEIGDAHSLATRIGQINARREAHDQATQSIREAERLKASLENRLAQRDANYTAVFEKVDLESGDEDNLRTLLAHKDEFDELSKKIYAAEQKVRGCKSTLAGHEELSALSREEIMAERTHAQAFLDESEDVPMEIGAIQEQVHSAREGHELEEALGRRDDALATMRQRRGEEGSAVVGHTLSEFIVRQSAENLPPVFRRARELLGAITGERLRLDFEERDGGQFRVHDNSEGTFKAMDELSSGEKVQLLISVRLAFVEQQEQELSGRLPLLIDEALATSDDDRVIAIIDTVIEIARSGRQVFYFTAQLDEVAKWRSCLEKTDLEWHTFDLDAIRRRARVTARPLTTELVSRPVTLAPGVATREQYGEILSVPGLNPWAADARTVHLWHLIDDLDELHKLLCLRIETWGQYEQLASNRGFANEGETRCYQRVRARADVIDAALRSWQIGRSRPIDRLVLAGADGVSETMLDRVDEVLQEVEGDAGALVSAIREPGRIQSWRLSNTDTLEVYLTEQGHIDTRQRLATPDINARVVASTWADIESGLVDQAFIDRIVLQLADTGSPAATAAATSP